MLVSLYLDDISIWRCPYTNHMEMSLYKVNLGATKLSQKHIQICSWDRESKADTGKDII